MLLLNELASELVGELESRSEQLRIEQTPIEGGGRVFDCGISNRGGLAAGISLARICLANLAEVAIAPGTVAGQPCALVQVATDHPALACLGSQYAGWQLAEGKFFAMGSGPMRAAYAHEPIFERIGYREKAGRVVGVLEGRKLPPPEIVAKIAASCGVGATDVTLLIAPTATIAGGVQVVARSVETAMHKLAELGFDLDRVVAGFGAAPLPPVAKDDLAAIGRTNDAVLYGARVLLHVTGDDESLADVGARVPSAASRDYGEPFARIFAAYNHDFYKVDPHLFSPAEFVFQNVETGRSHHFGSVNDSVLAQSFFG